MAFCSKCGKPELKPNADLFSNTMLPLHVMLRVSHVIFQICRKIVPGAVGDEELKETPRLLIANHLST